MFTLIQLLRALAASFVVLLHAQSVADLYSAQAAASYFSVFNVLGGFGVDLFFVISGFIMMHSSAALAGKPGAGRYFLTRRVIRIAPLYWIMSTVVLLLLLAVPQLFNRMTLDPWNAVASYFFIPARNSLGLVHPLVPVGWTLSYEMYFYMVFALLLFFPRRYLLASLALFFLGSVLLGWIFSPRGTYTQFLTNILLLEFILGGLVAALLHKGWLPGPSVSLCMAGVACAWIIVAAYSAPSTLSNRITLWGMPALLLVLSAVALELKSGLRAPRWVVALGDSSYALYLTHYFVLALLGRLWVHSWPDEWFGANGLIIFGYILCLAVGHLVYRMLEKPLTRWLLARAQLKENNK